jgi:UDP-glucuronate 4-epimerase
MISWVGVLQVKMERSNYFGRVASRWHSTASARLLSCSAILLALTLFVLFRMSLYNGADQYLTRVTPIPQAFKPDHVWETRVRQSCLPKKSEGLIVLVTGAAGFVGTHVSLALKKRGDGVLGIDNFNSYYEVSLKRARQELLEKQEIFIIEDDINNKELLKVLFDLIQFTHLMHLAAQAGVRYAMQNPGSYVHSNIAGFVTLLEACKDANPQPAIVWASSSSVYGLNSKVWMQCACSKYMSVCDLSL